MWPAREAKRKSISDALREFSGEEHRLKGIENNNALEVLSMQMVASLRRMDYSNALLARDIAAERANPNSILFDPERAAILHARQGNLDEAAWLIFLSIHFGKHLKFGWKRLQDVYSGLGQQTWTWLRVSQEFEAFDEWLQANAERIGGAFGNHRKYESLDPSSRASTIRVIESYLNWVGPDHSHVTKFGKLVREGGNDPRTLFDHFYNDMRVHRFGRLGKFDFLALLGRLRFAPIEPGTTYLKGATGPLRGARLLFANDPEANISVEFLEASLVDLDEFLSVGMQVMEDSLCNWQKSPMRFIHFRG